MGGPGELLERWKEEEHLEPHSERPDLQEDGKQLGLEVMEWQEVGMEQQPLASK